MASHLTDDDDNSSAAAAANIDDDDDDDDINDAGMTGLIVAMWRERENHHADPLVIDPYAASFRSERAAKHEARLREITPGCGALLPLRTKYIDDVVMKEVWSEGTRQVIILGSGLDCRPLRLYTHGVKYFEADYDAVLKFKSSRLSHLPFYPRSRLLPGDYITTSSSSLWSSLSSLGWDPSSPTLVIWEGNVRYLDVVDVERLLGEMKRRCKGGVKVVFEFVGREVVEQRTGDEGVDGFARYFEVEVKAPWRTGVEPRELAGKVGFEVLDVVSFPALCKRLRGRRDPLITSGFEHFGVALLASKPGG